MSTFLSMIMPYLGTSSILFFSIFHFYDMFHRYCPPHLHRYLEIWTHNLSEFFNPYVQITIHEHVGSHLRSHEAYALAEAYLTTKSEHARRLKAEMPSKKKITLSMDVREKTVDEYNGVKVSWYSGRAPPQQQQRLSFSHFPDPENKFFELKFHKRDKMIVTGSYLDHVMSTGQEIKTKNRQRKLYTNGAGGGRSCWSDIVFEHPATFERLAMEADKKAEIVDDLLTFSKSKDFYKRIGKAWKRGYLLFGPPGTGKSTMIAAMANLLDYDVYDLELTSVKDNTELRRVLTETSGKSIIVIEDIDCSLNLTGQRKNDNEKATNETDMTNVLSGKEESSSSKVTLSGLLNFIDGLWSASAGERLIVFTTNHVDKLDPALTRSGRMDKHIELSYCGYEGFKVLSENYLQIKDHYLFGTVEKLIEKVEIAPADVAENLLPKSARDGPEECISNLIRALEKKIEKTPGTEVLEDAEGRDEPAVQHKEHG